MSNAQDEDEGPAVSTANCEARQPLGQLQLLGRILLLGDRLPRQRSVNYQPRRQTAAVLRATDGQEPQPFRFPEAHGGVH